MGSLEALFAFIAPLLDFVGEHLVVRAVAVVLLALLAALIIDRLVMRLLRHLTARTSSGLDDQILGSLGQPLFQSIMLLGLAVAITVLKPAARVEALAFSLMQSYAVLLWSLFVTRLARMLLRNMAQQPGRFALVRNQTLPLFENVALLLIIGLALYLIFSAWHVDMTAWLASAGIIGIAVGFAAKDTLANLFSGVFILADAPYKIGDYIVLDSGERGEVTHIGIRSTRILTRGDVEVTVPNSIMGNTKILNESGGPHTKYRIGVPVGVAYGSDIDRVRAVLLEVVLAEAAVCDTPEPRVRLRRFGNSSVDFELLGWIEEPSLRGRVVDALLTAIYKRFMSEGIEIPYNKQDLYIKELPGPE
ncbi:MAG: mechanosensitive ion channel family protein [Gammaproteobacteria bacterium]|nr:mechanosensitive ion channel family protein [Gammaproteobacteria bacterium]